MWGLPKGEDYLPKVSLQTLQQAYNEEKNAKAKVCLLCAIHRKQGESTDAIMGIANLSRSTVHDILHRFVERGIEGKNSIRQTGRPPRLTPVQRKTLIRKLERGPPGNKSGLWTTKEVREYIYNEFGVKYSLPHIWELLKVAGFSIQRPRPRHHKAPDKEEVARFKKRLPGWRTFTEGRVSLSHARMKPHLV